MAETILQQINLSLQHLDLLILFILLYCYLLIGLHFGLEVITLITVLECLRLLFQILQLHFLEIHFVFQSLVLGLDVSLNFGDVLFSIAFCFFSELCISLLI